MSTVNFNERGVFMKKISNFLVEKRLWFFIITVIVAIACVVLMEFVTVNEDMSQYLPEDSDMRAGLEIMNSEFPPVEQSASFRVMLEGDLTAEEKVAVANKIAAFEGVSEVQHDPESPDYNSGIYTLFEVKTDLKDVAKAEALLASIEQSLATEHVVYSFYSEADYSVLTLLLPIALSIFVLVLVLLCGSYIEVVLLLAGIAFSILLNMGTNIIFPSISDSTRSIAAILQLVLSIDYSVIMLHRYQQEKALLEGKDNVQAMKNAITRAFSSVSSSALTTIVGLLILLFMRFTIGADMGLVMAKGIFFSLLCVFTVMPCLILWCDKLLTTTSKKYIAAKLKSKKGDAKNA